jgi:hypothetical protein
MHRKFESKLEKILRFDHREYGLRFETPRAACSLWMAWRNPPCRLVIFGCLLAATARTEDVDSLYHPYRADEVPGIEAEVPTRLEILPAGGRESWPEPVRADLAVRLRSEWGPGLAYGAVHAGIGIWVDYPLVTSHLGDRVAVPVLEASEIPVRGVLDLPRTSGPRRVVVLVDASQSANAPTLFRGAGGAVERVSVLEAERRALDRLLDAIDASRVEVAIAAFGETTHPIVPPGTAPDEARARLGEFFRAHPEGEGRTDTVCALWLARDWLADAPDGHGREVVLLTDGDLPHSGRFLDCGPARRRGAEAAARCEAQRNRSECPATSKPRASDGSSDLVQLSAFARRARGDVDVHALVFEADRHAKPYRELAERTGGRLARVPSAEAISAALPALVAREIRAVHARNASTGETTADLYDPATQGFEGSLSLVPGPNDVEIRVEGERGTAGLYRYRIYSLPGHLERTLARLREENAELARRAEALREEVQARRERSLEVVPAAPEGL